MLTFHRCINYGSYWQSRALVSGLRELGHDAVLLDHHDRAVEWREWRCALDPAWPARASRADRAAYAAKVRRFADAAGALPRSARFTLGGGAIPAGLDAVVVGSDEVWNPSHPWYGPGDLFWGPSSDAREDGPPWIAHAASSGGHAEALPADRALALRRFARITVRDELTRCHVEAATGVSPSLVLDPCLQFPPLQVMPLQRAPYALVYGHEFPAWVAAAARDWAKARGLRLLSIGYRADFADEQWLDAGPAAFASAVAGAGAVITTMFHGCVFALNAGVPFAAVPSPYRSAKVSDLLGRVGAARHLVAGPDDLVQALADAPGSAVHARIGELRAHSHAVLADALA